MSEAEASVPPLTSDAFKLEMAADILAAYVVKNAIPASELPDLISSIYASLGSIGKPVSKAVETAPPSPAVPIKKSVTDDFIICLEDGTKFKSLKRHLNTAYNMTPEAYRARWGLPKDYLMVAPNYAKARSDLAKKTGLGQGRAEARRMAKNAKKVPSKTKPERSVQKAA